MPTMAEALQDPQALADADPAAYYDQTPFMRSVWQGRVPTWLSQAYKQDIAPAYEAWEKPWDNPDMTQAVLGTAALPAKALTGMASAFVDQGQRAMANPTVENVFPLALDVGMLGAPVSRIPGMVPKGNALLGAHVWQGGPHKYGPEGAAESLKHIGRGEGAQAYGWGRYDAGAREVAEQYARKLRFERPNTVDSPESYIADSVNYFNGNLDAALGSIKATAELENAVAGPMAKKALAIFDDVVAANKSHLYKHDLPDEDIARYLDWDAPLSEQGDIGERMIQAIKSVERPSPAQSAADQALLDELGVELADFAGAPDPTPSLTGAQAYNTMQELMGGRGSVFDKEMPAQKAASEALARAGIPGLKYLDGMSRSDVGPYFPVIRESDGSVYQNVVGNADAAAAKLAELNKMGADEVTFRLGDMVDERTRNYVTWDQDVLNRMKMLERNGVDMQNALMGNK
jgi:hypothetical protein